MKKSLRHWEQNMTSHKSVESFGFAGLRHYRKNIAEAFFELENLIRLILVVF